MVEIIKKNVKAARLNCEDCARHKEREKGDICINCTGFYGDKLTQSTMDPKSSPRNIEMPLRCSNVIESRYEQGEFYNELEEGSA